MKTIIKKPILNFFIIIILPMVTLVSYLFYLFWSAPLSMILQQFSIQYLYILNNSYLHYCLIAIVILGILLFSCYYLSLRWAFIKIFYNFFLGLILFVVILPLLYNLILPYNYGIFTDNNTLTPLNSLLGFSKLYYLLDLFIISISILLSIILIKYNKVNSFYYFICECPT